MDYKDIFPKREEPEVVYEHEGKWYFWDEIYSDSLGPYKTKEEAEAACRRYAEQL
jgi:hypothetical protein